MHLSSSGIIFECEPTGFMSLFGSGNHQGFETTIFISKLGVQDYSVHYDIYNISMSGLNFFNAKIIIF